VRPDAEPNCEICKHARAVLREWLDKQGHDRCHYYPEIFNELSQLFGLKATKEAALPPRKEFEAGCARFADEEYGRALEYAENNLRRTE
jgi:hypothetical protein